MVEKIMPDPDSSIVIDWVIDFKFLVIVSREGGFLLS
jgi:hypothetical protein